MTKWHNGGRSEPSSCISRSSLVDVRAAQHCRAPLHWAFIAATITEFCPFFVQLCFGKSERLGQARISDCQSKDVGQKRWDRKTSSIILSYFSLSPEIVRRDFFFVSDPSQWSDLWRLVRGWPCHSLTLDMMVIGLIGRKGGGFLLRHFRVPLDRDQGILEGALRLGLAKTDTRPPSGGLEPRPPTYSPFWEQKWSKFLAHLDYFVTHFVDSRQGDFGTLIKLRSQFPLPPSLSYLSMSFDQSHDMSLIHLYRLLNGVFVVNGSFSVMTSPPLCWQGSNFGTNSMCPSLLPLLVMMDTHANSKFFWQTNQFIADIHHHKAITSGCWHFMLPVPVGWDVKWCHCLSIT